VTVTVEMLKAAKMRGVMFLDGEDFYSNTYECIDFPELSKVKHGPAGSALRLPGAKHTTTIYVAGREVPMQVQAIVDAINAHRAETVS
jgi:hypothetical protein